VVGPASANSGQSAARAWRPAISGIREVFHARFADHAYPPHTHDAWTLFIVDEGAIHYDLERRGHIAAPSMVTALPPFIAHDGRPATGDGFAMRVLYLDPAVVGEDAIGHAVDEPVVRVPGLRRRIDRLHRTLGSATDPLEAEVSLAGIAEDLRAAFRPGRPTIEASDIERPDVLAEALRAFLEAHLTESVTIAAAAEELGGSPTGLARSFARAFGIPPHAWLLGRRLELARERIVGGAALADVAAELGFADQAHLTRAVRAETGHTPGRLRTLLAPTQTGSAAGRTR
jgi:AraC-like DNA-binding protein